MKHSEVALGNLSLHLYNPKIRVQHIAFNHTIHIDIRPHDPGNGSYVTIVVQDEDVEQFLSDISREILAAVGQPLHNREEEE